MYISSPRRGTGIIWRLQVRAPGFFQCGYGVAMIVLSLALVASSVLRKASTADTAVNWRRVLGAFVVRLALVVCVALLKILGVVLSDALFTFCVVAVLYARPLKSAALVLWGFKPGPLLLQEQPDLFWGLVASMYIGDVMLLVLSLPLVPVLAQLLRLPVHIHGFTRACVWPLESSAFAGHRVGRIIFSREVAHALIRVDSGRRFRRHFCIFWIVGG